MEQINKNSSKEFEYTYDAIGSQLTQKEYDTSVTLIEEQTFTYHENGLLKNVLIDDSDGQDPDKNEYYQYNGQGQRIVKEFNDGTDTTMTRYMCTGSEVIMTANSAGLKTTENILTPSGQIVSSQRFNSNGNGTGWYSYNYDIRQSTTTIVNSAGTSMNSYLYDAFGETDATESFLNEVEFTGATSDSNIGLYYMNARYYNPNTGRFISQDSYKGSAYEPWTQNLYVYTGNNPVNYVDPTGHYFAKIDIAGHYNSGSSVVVVPEPESRPDTTTGSSTGSGSGSSSSNTGANAGDNWLDSTEPIWDGYYIPTTQDIWAFAYNVAGMEIGMAPNITIENYDPKHLKGPKHLYTPKHLAPNSQTTISTSGVAWTMTGIGWALDMGNALTYDSGNTGRQRLQKMGIDTLAVVMNVAWGMAAGAVLGASAVGGGQRLLLVQ